MKITLATAAFVAMVAPSCAFASFYESAAQARNQVTQLSQQQLDALNARVFTDAFLTAKIVGYDKADIDQLKADVRVLKEENAQLRRQLNERSVAVGYAPNDNIDDARISALETKFDSLQNTLGTVVKMLALILSKLQ